MNINLLPIVCLVSLTLAEPPVGDGYPAARSSDHHHSNYNDHDHTSDHERSLSQEYGPPGARNAISSEYGAPNARNSQNHREQTQKHAPPAVRISNNQRFSSAASRTSTHAHNSASNARSGVSQEYGLPESRSLSQEYGAPSLVSARTLSSEYRASARSPSGEYGVPVARNSQKHSASKFRNQNSLSEDYSVPKSQLQTVSQSGYATSSASSNDVGYEAPNSYAKSSDTQSLSQTYGTPKNAPSSTYNSPSRTVSTSYGAPSARNSGSHSQDYDSFSQSNTALNERGLSETYGAPNARSLSQEYGVPSSRSNLKTDALTSSYTSASSRSSPSSNYLPAARDAPSQQYGVPEHDNQGYENSRARALEELLNQEPANYDFAYQIEDQESGSDFGHTETRHENRAEGSYFVVLPDGTKQTVEYEADERGYKPRITIEPASGGYDKNAQDLARSQGPY